MLLANRTVAESIGKVKKGKKPKTLPYRIHDNPDPQKLETLREFVVKFGYKMKEAEGETPPRFGMLYKELYYGVGRTKCILFLNKGAASKGVAVAVMRSSCAKTA